ncbi:P-loop NTPase fold protein [Streptomyces hokutonensis]|uniref:P-loop NTPase fold protein n=1 Tax=Streptomyces hokutonensis TaxID=1306990 RepID=A0ABW6M5T4_9ACTN
MAPRESPRPHRVTHQLPRQVESFIGRYEELQDLLRHLAPAADPEHEPPPVVVTGPAGIGKTSLALQAAHEAVGRGWFPGGSRYLNRHEADRVNSSDALESVLRSLDWTLTPEQIPINVDSRAAMYRTVLSGLTDAVLLLVDDIDTADQARLLLPVSGRHRVVFISRHSLQPLAAHTVTLGRLSPDEAVDLLEARVRGRNSDDTRLSDDPGSARIIAELTSGLPLALSLVAGRLRNRLRLQPADVAQELTEAMSRARQLADETGMAGAFELSYRNLPPEQAQLLSLLALTVGRKFSTETAAAGLESDAHGARGLLVPLAEAKLIESTSRPDQWEMRDLIRAHAATVADDVIDATQREQARDRILDFALHHSDVAEDGSGFFTTRVGTRPLAGVHSDAPSQEDHLGVARDVEVLAELIAAAETRPPLSIALIGNWGAGKSSLMLQIGQHVDLLARLSRARPGRSAFVSSVRQVRFNAWHYSDTSVWTGLITQLFAALANEDESDAPSATPDPRQAQRDRETLRAELDRREETERQLSDQLTAADGAMPPPGRFTAFGSPVKSYRVLRAALLQTVKDLRFSLPVLALWLALAGVATGAWLLRGTLTAVVTSLLAAAAATAAPLRPLLRRLRTAHRELRGFTERRYAELAAQQRALRTEISGLRERLALIDAAARLGGFLQERAAGTEYQPYLGVLGQAHTDLRQLSHDLQAARAQWRAEGTGSRPPLERIVLYIDDLDRCPPDRVVEVLQAVHLMLGLDLFVVVVAVDARWLIHSLRHHHNALFQHETTTAAVSAAPDVDGLATTVDYLDKIFQIPYAVTPPPPQAMGRYLRSLLPTTVAEHNTRTAESTLTPDQPPPAGQPGPDGDNAPPAPREPTTSAASPDTGTPDQSVEQADLLPRGLRIGAGEVAFMAQLGGLLPTPRAAKRLVNLYRLVRIGVPATDLPAFASSSGAAPYQAVQILLAVLAGNPPAAEELFRRLLACPDGETSINSLLDGSPRGQPPYERLARVLPGVLRDLETVQPIPLAVGHYRRWCTELARYSFHTRELFPTADEPPTGRELLG